MSRRGSSRGGRQTRSLGFVKKGPAKRAPRQRTMAKLETKRAKAKAKEAGDVSSEALTRSNGGAGRKSPGQAVGRGTPPGPHSVSITGPAGRIRTNLREEG
jgi:hypothetical protein